MQPRNLKWMKFGAGLVLVVVLCGCNQKTDGAKRRQIEANNPGLLLWCDPNYERLRAVASTTLAGYTAQELSGEPCFPSASDSAAPNTQTGGAYNAGSGSTTGVNSNRQPGAAISPTGSVSLQEDYPTLLPLPFTPLFTPASLAAYVPACTSNVSVYGVNHFNSTVKRFTTCPLALGQTIQVGTHPLQAAFTPDGGTLIVTRFDNAVVFIDTATDTVTTTLPTSSYNPNGIAISPDGTKAYITSYNAFTPVIFVIDIPSRKIMPQTLQVNSYPKSIFLTPDGALAWVTFAASSSLYVIDTLSMTVAATVNAGGVAETGLAFSPDGTRAYVAVLGGQVAVFDTATLSQVALIAVGDQPTDILVSSDGSRAYVNSYAANAVMSVIDTATNTVLQTIPQGGPAMGLSIVH